MPWAKLSSREVRLTRCSKSNLSCTSALGGPFEMNSWQTSVWLMLVQSEDEVGLSLRSSGLMTEATSSLKMDKSSDKRRKNS